MGESLRLPKTNSNHPLVCHHTVAPPYGGGERDGVRGALGFCWGSLTMSPIESSRAPRQSTPASRKDTPRPRSLSLLACTWARNSSSPLRKKSNVFSSVDLLAVPASRSRLSRRSLGDLELTLSLESRYSPCRWRTWR